MEKRRRKSVRTWKKRHVFQVPALLKLFRDVGVLALKLLSVQANFKENSHHESDFFPYDFDSFPQVRGRHIFTKQIRKSPLGFVPFPAKKEKPTICRAHFQGFFSVFLAGTNIINLLTHRLHFPKKNSPSRKQKSQYGRSTSINPINSSTQKR